MKNLKTDNLIKEKIRKYKKHIKNLLIDGEVMTYLYDKTKFLNNYNPSLKERIYYVINDLVNVEICKYCGKKLIFKNHFTPRKSFYCSMKCAANSIDRKNKIKQTCLERYGVENPSQNKDIQNKMKNTIIEKYRC